MPYSDRIPHLVSCAVDCVRGAVHTAIARTYARWWGVQFGAASRFFGAPILRRCPNSVIRVGTRCRLRSARWSNLVGVNRPCVLSTVAAGARVEIGDSFAGTGVIIAAARSITVGARVMCGANTTITDTDWHTLDAAGRAAGLPGEASPVSIGDDVWLGMNVVVLKGVTIGAGTVVAANSLVSSSLPANVVAAGQPARPIRPCPISRS